MKVENMKKDHLVATTNENGIVLPALLWWMGAPITLLVVLWLVGIV